MATPSLDTIRFEHNGNFKYEHHDFKNKKEWPMKRILEEAFFNASEDDRHKIEADVIARGSHNLWKRYMNMIDEFITLHQVYFKARMFLLANVHDSNRILNEFNTKELMCFVEAYRLFSTDIKIIPEKSNDSNRSRKKHDEPTRKEYLSSLKTRMLQFLMQEPHHLKKTPSLKIIKHLL